ncbi:anti-sigma factor [Saccharothrix sp. BKS2]|uniref:anti-sigma factor n=1 Tax=Saccharothrix sp. BKS2 TaxID=3064400 RepID=UPI0039EA0984
MTGERRGDWCPQEELAVGFAMHALEPDEEARLRDHLPGCARCREAIRATEEVTAALGASVPQLDPPPRLRARLMAAVEQEPQESGPRAVAEPVVLETRRRRGGTWRRVLAAAAGVAVLAAGGVAGVRLDRLGDEVAAQGERADRLEGALRLAADPSASRAVLRTGSGEEVAVLLSADDGAAVVPTRLSTNDREHTYVVWGTSTDPAAPLAVFDVTSDGSVVGLAGWSSDAHRHTGFAISLEPGRAMPAEPTDVVAAGQVAST